MKKLIDDSEVSSRSYYYLLDWNDQDGKETMMRLFSKVRLCDLELYEFKELFKLAVKTEF